jgi:hypothetical protein
MRSRAIRAFEIDASQKYPSKNGRLTKIFRVRRNTDAFFYKKNVEEMIFLSILFVTRTICVSIMIIVVVVVVVVAIAFHEPQSHPQNNPRLQSAMSWRTRFGRPPICDIAPYEPEKSRSSRDPLARNAQIH